MLERKSGMEIFNEAIAKYEQAVVDGNVEEVLTEMEALAYAEALRQEDNLKVIMERNNP